MSKSETLTNSSTVTSIESFLRAHNTPGTRSRDTLSISRLLENKPELPGFIEAWRYKPRAQFREEMASYCMETLRVSDPYRFILTPEGELFSPVTKCRIKDVVKTNTHIGKLEFEALEKIERFTATHKKGIICWVSPLDPVEYPDNSKIVISEIEEIDGVKTLFNRAIILDIDQKECFKLALILANYSINKPSLFSVDEVRSNPLILNPEVKHWTYILEEAIANLSLKNVRNGEDIAIKEKTLRQVENLYQEFFAKGMIVDANVIAAEMGKREMVGAAGTSCPKRTAFGVFADSSKEVGLNCEKVKCRRCGWEPNSGDEKRMESGELTSCPGKIKGEDGKETTCGWAPGQAV